MELKAPLSFLSSWSPVYICITLGGEDAGPASRPQNSISMSIMTAPAPASIPSVMPSISFPPLPPNGPSLANRTCLLLSLSIMKFWFGQSIPLALIYPLMLGSTNYLTGDWFLSCVGQFSTSLLHFWLPDKNSIFLHENEGWFISTNFITAE